MTERVAKLILGSAGSELTHFNALRHGVLSRLQGPAVGGRRRVWRAVASLATEHQPQGPTEEHLVVELAGVLCRKRRLRRAEAAANRRGLESTFSSYRDTAKAALAHITKADKSIDVSEAVRVTPDLDNDEATTRRALDVLNAQRNNAYESALSELREGT